MAILVAGLLPDMTAFIESLLSANPPLAAQCITDSGGEQPAQQTIDKVQKELTGIISDTPTTAQERILAGNALNRLGDPRLGVGLRNDNVPEIDWCVIVAGEFVMGCEESDHREESDKESPQHCNYVSTFEIARYPITNLQYQMFINDGGYTDKWRDCWSQLGWEWRTQENLVCRDPYGGDFDLSNRPLVGASWYEATAFCNWLTVELGRTIRLPTEMEWEKAARGVDGRIWPWGDEPPTGEHCNFRSEIGTTSPVGVYIKGASPYGVLDMAGNTWEWTGSLYRPYPYVVSDGQRNPRCRW